MPYGAKESGVKDRGVSRMGNGSDTRTGVDMAVGGLVVGKRLACIRGKHAR